MNGISALVGVTRALAKPLCSPPCDDTRGWQSASDRVFSLDTESAGALILDFQPSDWGKKISVVFKPSVYGILL